MNEKQIEYQPLAINLINCSGNKCENNIIYNPQKKGEKCGKVDGGITRLCDIGLNCVKQQNYEFSKCEPVDVPCINCNKYRYCNNSADLNCVSGFQDCKPFPHTNYRQCSALFTENS